MNRLIALTFGMSLCLVGAGVAGDGKNDAPEEFYQLFEGSEELSPELRLFGIEPEKHVKLEPAGVRITLGTGYQGQRPYMGFATGFGLKGDFEITASFEILHEERAFENPEKFSGLCVEVIPQRPAERDVEQWMKPSQDKASLFRHLGPRKNTMFFAYTPPWDPIAGKDDVTPKSKHLRPTQAKAGRLRLVRTSAELAFLTSEGPDDDFTQIHKETFGQNDVNHVRVVATTSGVTAALTVRVKDLRVRAQSFNNVQPVIQKKAWWKPLVPVVVVVIVLSFGLLLWVGLRLLRKPRAPIAAADVQPNVAAVTAATPPAATDGAAGFLAFACKGCGKKLKTRADLAGKKVKCKHCGQITQVPGD
ncbi:MAG: hypothetical protein QOK44_4294 [Betaproteobacteria bacterium]|nr:hypothetical protein [Betaproteobacteria bacterium]